MRETRQRSEILSVARSDKHLSAEEIYRRARTRMENISMGTVYRNLNLLSVTGRLRHVQIPGMSAFFDANLDPHEHCLCEKCGRVFDIPPGICPKPDLSALNMQITECSLIVRVICPDCAANAD